MSWPAGWRSRPRVVTRVKQLTPSAPDPPSWQAALYASVQVTQTSVTAVLWRHSYTGCVCELSASPSFLLGSPLISVQIFYFFTNYFYFENCLTSLGVQIRYTRLMSHVLVTQK